MSSNGHLLLFHYELGLSKANIQEDHLLDIFI